MKETFEDLDIVFIVAEHLLDKSPIILYLHHSRSLFIGYTHFVELISKGPNSNLHPHQNAVFEVFGC